jgi:competence protein ComEC
MRAVGLVPGLALAGGAGLALWSGLDLRPVAWLLPLCGGAAWVAWRRRAGVAGLVALVAGFAAGGAALASDGRERALRSPLRAALHETLGGFDIDTAGPGAGDHPVPTRLRPVEDAAVRDGFVSLRARVTAIEIGDGWRAVDGGVSISVSGRVASDRAGTWRAGRLLEAPVLYRRPTRYLNDGVADLEQDQALSGITLLGTIKSGLLVDVLEPAPFPGELAARVRMTVRRAVTAWISPHDPLSGAIATAVVIGDRTGLPDETREALQAAGTYHVIAISGGNIAVLAALASLALALGGVRGRPAAVVVVAVLAAYALVVTAGPSVWRATLMAMLYFAALAIDQRTRAWHTVSVAVALMVVVRPLDLRDPGFILTFGATIALLEGGRLGARWRPGRPALAWLVAAVGASLAVELALLPVAASLFSRVTVAGLALNLLAVPLMAVVQMATLVVTAAAPVPWVAGPAGVLAHLAAWALVASAGLVDLAPWSTARVPPPGPWLLVAYYTALATLLLARGRVARVGALVGLGASALAIAGVVPPWRSAAGDGMLRLDVFDVGQGEAMLLEGPSGGRVLVDAGGAPFGSSLAIGARVLLPALWARGVRRLDAFLLTHGDPDHVGGAPAVLQTFEPASVWEGVRVPGHAPTLALRSVAAGLGLPVVERRAGERLALGGMRLRVLHPPLPDWERREVRNDDSVVLEIRYGDVALLLTGDVSADVERSLLPRLTPAPIRVLKVAHHGSRTSTSTALLEWWRPQIAILSAGRGNSFGHPTPEVLARLAAVGATVLRTDLDGQITLETDGRAVWARTHTRRAAVYLTRAHSASISSSVAAPRD